MPITKAQVTKAAAWGVGLIVVCMILLSVPVFSLVQAGEGRTEVQARLTTKGLDYFHARCPRDLGEVRRAPRHRALLLPEARP